MSINWYTIVGLIAATLTTIGFLPQAIKSIRTRKTEDISLLMYIIFIIGLLLWLIYGVINRNLPIIISNSVTFIFSAVILSMKIKYG